MAARFFSEEWAAQARDAFNAGPSEEVKAGKLEKFWDWIEKAKEGVDCRLALAVRDLPDGRPDALLLDLEQGVCKEVRLLARADAEREATYLLAGDYADWQDIMNGYDVGKSIMYRKLLLEKGELLEFFRAAYYWTESLACIQRVPTSWG